MEATQATPPDPAGTPPPPGGELVLQNGRLSGTRTPLTVPVTVLGRAAGCDVRLNVDGVNPLHCVLVQGPEGLTVRDLGGETGTLVNGTAVGTALLQEGDTLAVGPFRFRVHLPPAGPSP